MLKNTQINKIATKRIATALGELNQQVVFVGGSVVSFYIDDPAAEDIRPTKDIDISMEIATAAELERIRELLNQKGFYHSAEDEVICRFRFEEIKVDLMSTKAIAWAPANPWFASGFQNLIQFKIDDIIINALSFPYFLASKFTAFYDRGVLDPRTSKDFEDIAYMLNYRSDFAQLIKQSDTSVRQYLEECIADILSDDGKQEALLANLFHEDQEYRFNKIIEGLNQIGSKE